MEIETKLKHNDKIPHNYVNVDKKEKILLDAVQDEQKLNDAITFLSAHHISCSSTEEVQAITNESVKGFIDAECKKFLSHAGFIPNAVVNETKMEYWRAYEELKPYVTTIEDINRKYSSVRLFCDENGVFHYEPNELEAYATEKATMHLTKQFRDAYEQYKKLAEVLKEVHQWEIDNNYCEVTVEGTYHYYNGQVYNIGIYSLLFGTTGGQPAKDLTPERFIQMQHIFAPKDR